MTMVRSASGGKHAESCDSYRAAIWRHIQWCYNAKPLRVVLLVAVNTEVRTPASACVSTELPRPREERLFSANDNAQQWSGIIGAVWRKRRQDLFLQAASASASTHIARNATSTSLPITSIHTATIVDYQLTR